MKKKELCICGKDITGNYLAHPPLWHFYSMEQNEDPDNEPWSELEHLLEAVIAVERGFVEPTAVL